MKNAWGYITLVFSEILLGLAYGLFLRNILSVEFLLVLAFCIPFTVLLISSKNRKNIVLELIEILFLSLLLMAVSIGTFNSFNRLSAEFIGEYDVVVESVYGRGGGQATFTTPLGKEGQADLHDYRVIIFDDEDFVDVGDTITVREYKGCFDEFYYVFVKEVP